MKLYLIDGSMMETLALFDSENIHLHTNKGMMKFETPEIVLIGPEREDKKRIPL